LTDAERDEDLLRYISDSITLIAQYTGGGEEAFRREPMIQDAVLRRLETLTDAARQLSGELTRPASRHSLAGDLRLPQRRSARLSWPRRGSCLDHSAGLSAGAPLRGRRGAPAQRERVALKFASSWENRDTGH